MSWTLTQDKVCLIEKSEIDYIHGIWDNNLSAEQIIEYHNHVLRWFADVKNSDEVFI